MNCNIILSTSSQEVSSLMEIFLLISDVVGFVSRFFSAEVKTGSAHYVMMLLPGFVHFLLG